MCFADNIVQVPPFVPKLKANVNSGGVIMPIIADNASNNAIFFWGGEK